VRFTFTQKFGSTPSEDEYNSVKDDFLTYINTSKLSADNVADESIRFRHLSSVPVVSLFKDCGSAIWTAESMTTIGRSGSWDLYRDTAVIANNTLQLDHSTDSDSPGTELVEFTLWYYPYSIAMGSEVAPAIKVSGAWQAMVEHRRSAGIGIGFYTPYEQLPYSGSFLSVATHPFIQYAPQSFTGRADLDRAGTVAYGGPIICTVTLSKADLANVESFGMMVKHDTSLDYVLSAPSLKGVARKNSFCSVYDRLFLSLVARDN
jgi:hypothetical protein